MSTTTIARTTCKYPGCAEAAAPAAGTGRPPEYCAGRGHTRVSAWRERRRLVAEQAGTVISAAEDGSPLTTARMTGAELLRSLRAEADRITALGAGLRDQIGTFTDPTAAEAEVEAVRAAAQQLGEVIAQRIDEHADYLAGDDQPGEGYLAKVARLTAARDHAKERVLGDYLLLPPASDMPADDGNDDEPVPDEYRPVVVDRGHPSWAEVDAEQRERLGDPPARADRS